MLAMANSSGDNAYLRMVLDPSGPPALFPTGRASDDVLVPRSLAGSISMADSDHNYALVFFPNDWRAPLLTAKVVDNPRVAGRKALGFMDVVQYQKQMQNYTSGAVVAADLEVYSTALQGGGNGSSGVVTMTSTGNGIVDWVSYDPVADSALGSRPPLTVDITDGARGRLVLEAEPIEVRADYDDSIARIQAPQGFQNIYLVAPTSALGTGKVKGSSVAGGGEQVLASTNALSGWQGVRGHFTVDLFAAIETIGSAEVLDIHVNAWYLGADGNEHALTGARRVNHHMPLQKHVVGSATLETHFYSPYPITHIDATYQSEEAGGEWGYVTMKITPTAQGPAYGTNAIIARVSGQNADQPLQFAANQVIQATPNPILASELGYRPHVFSGPPEDQAGVIGLLASNKLAVMEPRSTERHLSSYRREDLRAAGFFGNVSKGLRGIARGARDVATIGSALGMAGAYEAGPRVAYCGVEEDRLASLRRGRQSPNAALFAATTSDGSAAIDMIYASTLPEPDFGTYATPSGRPMRMGREASLEGPRGDEFRGQVLAAADLAKLADNTFIGFAGDVATIYGGDSIGLAAWAAFHNSAAPGAVYSGAISPNGAVEAVGGGRAKLAAAEKMGLTMVGNLADAHLSSLADALKSPARPKTVRVLSVSDASAANVLLQQKQRAAATGVARPASRQRRSKPRRAAQTAASGIDQRIAKLAARIDGLAKAIVKPAVRSADRNTK